MKNLLQKIRENKKLKKRIITVASAMLAFALFVSSVVVYQKSKQNIKAAESTNKNALEETLNNEQTNNEAESENSSDGAAENFESDSEFEAAQNTLSDSTSQNNGNATAPSNQTNSSTGSKKPNGTFQNGIKPSKPANASTNNQTITTQLAVNVCKHNWKLISYTNGCYVYHCSKCNDYKSEEREMNPNDFMGNKSEYLEFLSLLNKARRAEGLNELQYCPDSRVQNIADIRAKELTVSFSHTRPDGSAVGKLFNEYTESTDGLYDGYGGEAICSVHDSSPKSAFDGFMNSPKHRKILMCEGSTHFVCARCDGYWVVLPLVKATYVG